MKSFNLYKHIKSFGFIRRKRNESHPADATHRYKYIHPDIDDVIVDWGDGLLSIGRCHIEFDMPYSVDAFLKIAKEASPQIFAHLQNKPK